MKESLDLREAGMIAFGFVVQPWEPTSKPELRAALVHHDRIIEDLARLLRHGAGVRRHPERAVTLNEAAQRPASALLGLLEQHPAVGALLTNPPSRLLSKKTPMAGPWRDLNRALLVAAHGWNNLTATPPPDAEWGLVADVAALARAVAHAQPTLAEAAESLKLIEVAAAFRSPSVRALAQVAGATLDQARSGPTRDAWAPLHSPSVAPLLGGLQPATSAAEIPCVAAALGHALEHPGLNVDAVTTLAILRNHAMTSHIIGQYLTANGDTHAGEALTRQAALLMDAAATAHGRVWSAPGPPAHQRALAHAQQLYQLTRKTFSIAKPGTTNMEHLRIASAYVTVVPSITRALQTRITKSFELGAWATIDLETEAAELRWRPTKGSDLRHLHRQLRSASDAVHGLTPPGREIELGQVDHPLAAHRAISQAFSQLQAIPPTASTRPTRPSSMPRRR